MALTQEQRDIILNAKARGLTKQQALSMAFKQEPTTPQPGRFDDVGEDITSAVKGAGRDLYQRGQNIIDSFQAGRRGEQTPFETGGQIAGNIIGGAGDLGFRGVQAAVTPFMSEGEERAVEGAVTDLFAPVGEKIAEMSPRTQRNITGGLGLFEGLTAGAGGAATKPATTGIKGAIQRFMGRTGRAVDDTSPTPTPRTPEQTIETAANRIQQLAQEGGEQTPRQAQEAAQAALNWREKMIGLTPDVKNRLGQMEETKLMEYINGVYRRNVDDTAPTPYEIGARNVDTAEQKLREVLNDTGSGIGQTRQKLSTYKLQQPQVENIDRIFKGEIEAMGLTIKNGRVVEKPNRISPASAGDISAMNSLLDDLNTFKQSPTLANAIDLRKNFDSKIKFGQSARDVSNEVDPLSRAVRSTIADEAAKTVGKEQAALVKQYSDFMDAYGDLRSYTNRRAGGEYLLRLVLSGRGGEARQLISTIKDYTGVDLMNDATAMKVATEMFGTDATKNLFRQEISKAGYDAATVLRGDAVGTIGIIIDKLADRIDAEDVLRKLTIGGGSAAAAYVLMENNPEYALPIGFVIGSTIPGGRKELAKRVAKHVDPNTADEMFDFTRVIREGGVTTNNKGELQFKAIEGMNEQRVKRVFDDGLRAIEMDADMMDALAQNTPGDIAKFYDEVLENISDTQKKDSPKAESATPKTTDLLEEARKYTDISKTKASEFKGGQVKLYHQTDADLKAFDRAEPTFFNTTTRNKTYGENTIEALVDIKKPYNAGGEFWVMSEQPAKIEAIRKKGYDAIIFSHDFSGNGAVTQVIVIDPTKTIKSTNKISQ